MAQTAPPQELLEYVRQMKASGYAEPDIRTALRNAGWDIGAIEAVFAYLYQPIIAETSVANGTGVVAPVGHGVITQQEYPITRLWSFKATLVVVVLSLVLLVFNLYAPALLLVFPFTFFYDPLRRHRFKFQITEQELATYDGASLASAKRKKIVPLAAVQRVELRRDLADQLLGLAKIVIDTSADVTSDSSSTFFGFNLGGGKNLKLCPQMIGTLVTAEQCPQTTIPGLSHTHARVLQELLQNRVRVRAAQTADGHLAPFHHGN